MAAARMERWLEALGYTESPASLFRSPEQVPATHRYAAELRSLLGPIGVKAVFDVDGTPTVAFIESVPGDALASIRQQIWNQNLITILLEIEDGHATAYSPQPNAEPELIVGTDVSARGPWSITDVQSGSIVDRVPSDWFDAERRIDHDLLSNLGAAVAKLREGGLSRDAAQYLVGQTLFVSYLEHRGILGDVYCAKHGVGSLITLVVKRDRRGLSKLFKQLKKDFNGDFLGPALSEAAQWQNLGEFAFDVLERFLQRVDINSGQQSFWNYDFRYIPVELLSGIYETFLGDERDALGAFYTPRHLAQLTVDFAFADIDKPAEQVIYDGACGSGILLTCAFRRMLGHAAAERGSPLSLVERIELLKSNIFGSDLSEPACRVTAFSLYLSLLEELVPRDLAELTEDPDVKLPPLLGSNLRSGKMEGDFFSDANPFAGQRRFSILLSNPPWAEAKLKVKNAPLPTYERWATSAKRAIVRRQIAAAYAQRAADCLMPNGRLVLILPISLMLAPTSQPFIIDWFARVKPERIVNFGDLRRQLFAEADHGCAVVVARPRDRDSRPLVPVYEHFDYWAPKVDVSLAFGRLTLHTSDRMSLQTQAVIESNAVLRYRAWGSAADERLIRRLIREGTIDDLCQRPGWSVGKGFNRARHSSEKLDPGHLKKMRYLDARNIPRDAPIVPTACFQEFPAEIDSVVSFGSQDGIAFSGPRVLYPDGLSSELEMRAVFTKQKCCFKHTIAAIRGPAADEDLLRFLAIYLRSPLMRYVILQTAYSPANERERITVTEVGALPIKMPTTAALQKIVTQVADISRAVELDQNKLLHTAPNLKKAYALVERYMGLSEAEAKLVHDIADWALPSRQRGSRPTEITPWQSTPTDHDLTEYSDALQRELSMLRDARKGNGNFEIIIQAASTSSDRGVGIVEVRLVGGDRRVGGDDRVGEISERAFLAVSAIVDKLVAEHALPLPVTENLFLASDICVIHHNSAFLIKPLARRLWRVGFAAEDADRILYEATEARPPLDNIDPKRSVS